MSALPPKADIVQYDDNVRFVPKAEVAVIRAMPVPPLPAALIGRSISTSPLAPKDDGYNKSRYKHYEHYESDG
jgi:hypothetical protein